jgi:hypothetical protein
MSTPRTPLAERTAAIVRSIASGNNACGTLMDKQGRLNTAFIEEAVRPTLDVYEREADELRVDRARVSSDSENRRQCLEYIYSNAHGRLPPDVAARLYQVLGIRAS